MPDKLTEWSAVVQVREGEQISGDHYLICRVGKRVLVAVTDGLGHGPEAALASHQAVATLEIDPAQSLVSLFAACHKDLHSTRGVVMALALLDASNNTMAWLGVGNIQGRLLRADKTTSRPVEELFQYNGVVGHEMPSAAGFYCPAGRQRRPFDPGDRWYPARICQRYSHREIGPSDRQ